MTDYKDVKRCGQIVEHKVKKEKEEELDKEEKKGEEVKVKRRCSRRIVDGELAAAGRWLIIRKREPWL